MKNENIENNNLFSTRIEVLSPVVQFYHKGDIVSIKKIKSPRMVVNEIKFKTDSKGEHIKDAQGQKILLGVECYWFTSEDRYQKETFNTKDLILNENNNDTE